MIQIFYQTQTILVDLVSPQNPATQEKILQLAKAIFWRTHLDHLPSLTVSNFLSHVQNDCYLTTVFHLKSSFLLSYITNLSKIEFNWKYFVALRK